MVLSLRLEEDVIYNEQNKDNFLLEAEVQVLNIKVGSLLKYVRRKEDNNYECLERRALHYHTKISKVAFL